MALVTITAVYALLTFLILRANRNVVVNMERQQELLVRPYMVPSIEIKYSVVLVLVIRNEGKSPAKRLRMTLDSDFFQYGDHQNIREFSAFNEEISSFAPGTALRFDLAQGFVIFAKDADETRMPKRFGIRFRYAHLGKSYEEVVHIDLRPYLSSNPEHHPTADHLKKISDSIEAVSRALSEIRRGMQK